MVNITDAAITTAFAVFSYLFAKYLFNEYIYTKERAAAEKRVLDAEKEAFSSKPQQEQEKDNQDEGRSSLNFTIGGDNNVVNIRDIGNSGPLLNLYSQQIEKYQLQTQDRARSSFNLACVAMCIGMAFVGGGGYFMLTSADWPHIAGAAGIASIGGGVASFIARTFLDVHRLSLSQLNHYFRQPVINSHIITAQRIAEKIEDESARQEAYQQLTKQILTLIREDHAPQTVWTSHQDVAPTALPHQI